MNVGGGSASEGRTPAPRLVGEGLHVPRGRRGPHRRVAVVAEFNLTADSLRVALSKRGFQVVSTPVPTSGAEVRALDLRFHAFRPQAAVFMQDISNPVDLNSVTHTVIGLRQPRWLLLTPTPEGPRWGAVLIAGAAAVLPMSIGVPDLVACLTRLCRGQDVMSSAEKERLMRLWTDTSAEQRELFDRMTTLTRREMQVLQELSDGHAVAEIAEGRGVTVGTVRSQVKAILRKLGVSSQLAAVAAFQRAVEPTPGVHH